LSADLSLVGEPESELPFSSDLGSFFAMDSSCPLNDMLELDVFVLPTE
jgi:hypothetical protein